MSGVTKTQFSQELLKRIADCRALYEEPQAALLPVLHMVQDEHGHLTPALQEAVADAMEIPVSKVHEVVTFYTLFHEKPQGKTQVCLCQTMTCMLRGSRELIRHMEEKHGVKPGETSSNGAFTFHTVECLGHCEVGPMAQIGDDHFGPLTPEDLDKHLAQLNEQTRTREHE